MKLVVTLIPIYEDGKWLHTVKGIAITKECCPVNNNLVIDSLYCSVVGREEIDLNKLLGCLSIVCEGE